MGCRDSGKPVVIISHDVVGAQMAGPGIRYYHLARVLAQEFEVALLAPTAGVQPLASIEVIPSGDGDASVLADTLKVARAVLVPALWVSLLPDWRQLGVPLIVDGYDPHLAETLALGQGDVSQVQQALTEAYLAGDFFICASERQRDWWLGLLEAHGRINEHNYRHDPSLRCLVDVVPFGLPAELPEEGRGAIDRIWPGIGEGRNLLWGGGLWPWLDPVTAIRALAIVREQAPDVRLLFPGTRHPNPAVADMPTRYEEAVVAAEELGLLDEGIFFGDWVPYADWPGLLLGSDLALTLHYDSLEARLAFRSRVLDFIWAGLPVVATRGDTTSELITQYGVGITVDYEDAQGVAQAILSLLATPRDRFAEGFDKARRELTWEEAAEPLLRFCRAPSRSPDKERSGDQLGNPYYLSRIAGLEEKVGGYERGRFIRFMRFLKECWRSTRRSQ
jgi:glycosyltransferase involved in cell wall biosynthesis